MELQEVNSKKDLYLNCCQSLNEEFVELIKKAEYDKDNITSLVIKANGIKRKCEEKKKNIITGRSHLYFERKEKKTFKLVKI